MTPESIAHYQILGKLGEGAMGAVYRAMDTKLNREVAIKVVPEDVAESPDRMLRFQREAHVLAALNHPNIAAIYGVEDRALVMELVEGRTLAGPLTTQEALPIIGQLIDALEYAHEKGIIHRDLKPANIMITPQGSVKVLDFGLAKALAKADGQQSPILAARATMTGTIMGTTAYMSPEQARGWNLDRRSDIWTFGVLVWEMLTGRSLFQGESPSETLAAVFTTDPDFEAVPLRFRRLLKLCLTRDARQRLRDISGARLLLDEPEATASAPAIPVALPPPAPRRLPWILVGALAVLSAILGFSLWRATRDRLDPLMRLSVDLGPEAAFSEYLTAAISPNGRRLAYIARGPDGKSQLATRLLSESGVTLLHGTEDATVPFFSPDGEWIGFFAAGKLKKISIRGGGAVPLADVSTGRGASWSAEGFIVFSPGTSSGLMRVAESGGASEPLTRLPSRGEVSHRWPQVLPGGRTVLFTGHTQPAGWDTANIEALDLKTGEWKVLLKGGYCGRYLPSGHLVYVSRGMLYAVQFDAARLQVHGSLVSVLQDIGGAPIYGGGQYDVSQTGTLVYLRGLSVSGDTAFAWMDQAGKTEPVLTAPGTAFDPRFSPDGNRLAVSGVNGVLVYDFARQMQSTLTTPGQIAGRPIWTPDGKHLAHTWAGPGNSTAIYWIRSDGGGSPVQLVEEGGNPTPYSFSPDGSRLAFAKDHPETHQDLWILPLDLKDPDHPKPGPAESFLRTPANEQFPAFSPDGRWIAYMSDEGGTTEVYVRPYPPGPGKWQISTGGGKFSVWSPAGRELFFETSDNRIMVADYDLKAGFAPGKPRLWSEMRLASSGSARNFDVAPDGKRLIVMPQPQSDSGTVHVTFLMNFFDEVRRRVR